MSRTGKLRAGLVYSRTQRVHVPMVGSYTHIFIRGLVEKRNDEEKKSYKIFNNLSAAEASYRSAGGEFQTVGGDDGFASFGTTWFSGAFRTVPCFPFRLKFE